MRTLPDYLRKGMKLILVGCNPGESSARAGHYYAGRSNHFWPVMYDSGVIPEPLEYAEDKRLVEFGIGLTDPGLIESGAGANGVGRFAGFCGGFFEGSADGFGGFGGA